MAADEVGDGLKGAAVLGSDYGGGGRVFVPCFSQAAAHIRVKQSE